jgi:DNA-binding transcriptional LysR family regulator
MDLSDLHIFRSVVHEGGVTRAAEKLHRVQSNVTTRVRQLEEELGVQLFIRNGKRLHLSPPGRLLLDYADRLLDLAQEARDADTRTVLAFEAGCSHRQRLEDWFARSGEMPERIIEMSSYHAILGCAVARMGIALMPKSVLATFPDMRLLSVHPLPSGLNTSQTVLIWRKGAQSPKVSALLEILAGKPSQPVRRGRRAS